MRYRRIETVAYLLALALVGLAVAVAALRSRPAEPGPGPAPPPSPVAVAEPARGAELYRAECAACHGGAGSIPGGERYAATGDRGALFDLLLTGTVAGSDRGDHPDASHLGDADLAALASHFAAAWSDEAPAVSPEEVAAHRPPQQ